MYFSTKDEHHEKCIMQLNVTLLLKGSKVYHDWDPDFFYDHVCTDLLGNKLEPDNHMQEQDDKKSFVVKKSLLAFSLDGFVGDLNFYDNICGLQFEHENIGLGEILGVDEIDGLYYLVKDIIPIFKKHIKNAKKKKTYEANEKIFGLHLPTVWNYVSRIVEDFWSGGLERESEYDYLGILNANNLFTLDINDLIETEDVCLGDIYLNSEPTEKIRFIAEKINMSHMFDDYYAFDGGQTMRFDPIERSDDCNFLLKRMAKEGHGALIIWHPSGRVSCCFDPFGDSTYLGDDRESSVVGSAYKFFKTKEKNENRK